MSVFRIAGQAAGWRIARLLGIGLVLAGGLLASHAADDEETNPVRPEFRELMQKYAAVKEWQGIWEVNINEDSAQPWREGEHEEHTVRRSRGSFLLKQNTSGWAPRRGALSWKGVGEASGRISTSQRDWGYSTGYPLGDESEQYMEGVTTTSGHVFRLGFPRQRDKPEGIVYYAAPSHAKPAEGSITKRWVTPEQGFPRGKAGGETQPTNIAIPAWLKLASDNAPENWSVVAGGPGVLEFRSDKSEQKEAPGSNSYSLIRRSRLLLFPTYDNLEVEVTIEGYDEWRPKGTVADPKQPGNHVIAHATLKNKDGSPASELPPVRRFIFELKETSREPGICLNWPLDAKDNDPDLRLSGAPMGGELSQEDQKLVIKDVPKDEQQQPYAQAQVDSYDFGGRAELRVTCELEDGRQIVGLLKEPQGSVDIVRLPKMNAPGWIAESWRNEQGVSKLADDDDQEKVEGQDYKGDGFTLYEEYRGFVENGVHVEGDPKKKDLFILNLADVATRSGVSLFEQLSKVKTHARLRDGKEMTQEARLMNGNHRAAPHRVDQHGVVLSHVGAGKGGYTSSSEGADDKKAFRPRYTNSVYIEPPDAAFGLFSASVRERYGIDHLNPSQLYAAAVAHELLHSIGVDHHGESRLLVRWGYFQRKDNPQNPTGKPRFTVNTGSSQTLTLLWEDTQTSVAENQQAIYDQQIASSASGQQDYYKDAAEYWCNYLTFAGPLRGTDSGDEACVMRYYFATAYEAKGKTNTFYVMRPGVKQPETSLCKDPKGTGGNAASHQPQPRFGDAAGGRGDCFANICPNDAIPPKNIAIR